jgi:hypothetical protein
VISSMRNLAHISTLTAEPARRHVFIPPDDNDFAGHYDDTAIDVIETLRVGDDNSYLLKAPVILTIPSVAERVPLMHVHNRSTMDGWVAEHIE